MPTGPAIGSVGCRRILHIFVNANFHRIIFAIYQYVERLARLLHRAPCNRFFTNQARHAMSLFRSAILGGAMLLATVGSGSAAIQLSGNLTADNSFFAYLSTSADTRGTLIGSGNSWSTAFTLTTSTLTAGQTYYLNIEAINGDAGQYSAGGLLGAFTLTGGATFANGLSTVLTNGSSGWVAGYNNSNSSFTAQTWVQPTGSVVVEGTNGTSPWGTISGISTSASWIWASDSLSEKPGFTAPRNQCAGCTVDFQIQINTAAPEPASLSLFGLAAAGLGAIVRRRRSA